MDWVERRVRCSWIRESGEKEKEEEVNMDKGQGFIDAKQELNVDSGTLPCTLACSWACSCV